MAEDTILIVTADTEISYPEDVRGGDGKRGWAVDKIQQHLARATEIPASTLERNMNRFLQMIGRLFQQAEEQMSTQSDFHLNEVELQVEISGKGEVKLLAGGEAAGKGVITLRFKRQS